MYVWVAWRMEEGCLPLSTHDSKTCRELRGGRGGGKDNPNKHLEDILPGTPKLITVPRWHWHLWEVTRNMTDWKQRMKGDWGRVGRLGKQEPLSLAVIMCVWCVHLWVHTWSAHFASCPLRLCVGKWPSGIVMADRAWLWRPHAAVGETSQISRQDLRYRSAHWLTLQNSYSMGLHHRACMVHMVRWSQNDLQTLRYLWFLCVCVFFFNENPNLLRDTSRTHLLYQSKCIWIPSLHLQLDFTNVLRNIKALHVSIFHFISLVLN